MRVGGGRRGHLYAPTRLELTKSSSREEGGEDCDGDDDNATMRTTTLRPNPYSNLTPHLPTLHDPPPPPTLARLPLHPSLIVPLQRLETAHFFVEEEEGIGGQDFVEVRGGDGFV